MGLETSDAAPRLGITLETCRIHFKGTLAKTGAPRQSALLCLIASLQGDLAKVPSLG